MGNPLYDNGFLRAKVRAESQSNPNLAIRGDLSTFSGYVFNAGGANRKFGIVKFVNGNEDFLARIEEPIFTLNQDWWMEAGAVGSELSLKFWPVGDPEPEKPQIVVHDDEFSTGGIAITSAISVNLIDEPTATRTFYDDLTFRPVQVPEPGMGALMPCATIGLLSCVRRKARRGRANAT